MFRCDCISNKNVRARRFND